MLTNNNMAMANCWTKPCASDGRCRSKRAAGPDGANRAAVSPRRAAIKAMPMPSVQVNAGDSRARLTGERCGERQHAADGQSIERDQVGMVMGARACRSAQ